MGTIKINGTASEPKDMKRNGSNTKDIQESEGERSAELIMPIEHYVNIAAKVENAEGASVEGVKSAPRKKKAAAGSASAGAAAATAGSAKTSKAKVEGGAASGSASGSTGAAAAAAKKTAGHKKALALPAGSIGAAVLDEKEKAGVKAGAKKSANLAMDGMVKPKARTVQVTEVETTAEEEFEAHRPKEKKPEEEEEEGEEEKPPRFSKPKAALIGAGVALAVAIVGGVVIGMMGRKETPRCVVQFESNGGSKVESEEVVCGETVGRPEDPTKDGFKFQNWIYGGSPFDFEQMTIDENMMLVAKWEAEEGTEIVKVHFDTDGGTEIDDVEVKKGGKISEPVEPTRESYEFLGWRLGDKDFDFETPVEEDMTLVAQWKPVAGGSSAAHPNTPEEKPALESLAVADNMVMIGTPKRFDITIKPANANHKLTVTSSDASVATCSITDGARLQCEGKKPGEATMTLRDLLSGKTVQFKVTTEADVTFVDLNPSTLSLTVGGTETLTAQITAKGGVTVAGTWTSSNPGVATVDANGKVTAVGAGSATITVSAGGMSKSCAVTVSAKPAPQPPVVTPPSQGGDDDKKEESGENTEEGEDTGN